MQTDSTLAATSFEQKSFDPFDFDFQKPPFTNNMGIEMVLMGEKKDFEKHLDVDKWEMGDATISITSDSDEEKGFKGRGV
jgi:hypothetical protein